MREGQSPSPAGFFKGYRRGGALLCPDVSCGFERLLRPEDLHDDDRADNDDADHVRHRAGIHKAQSAGGGEDPQIPGDAPAVVALERHPETEHADERRDSNHNDLHDGRIDEHHRGVVGENIRDDERCDSELRCVEGGLHRICARNGGAGVGRERDRRREVGDDAEVEHKEVRRDRRDAHLYENGRAGRGHDAVVGGRRNAHAEHDAAEHCEEEREELRVAANADDGVQDLVGETGHRETARDDARHAAGDADRDAPLRTAGQSFKEFLRSHACFFGKHAYDDRGDGCYRGGKGHCPAAGRDEIHKDHERQQQIRLFQKRHHGRQLAAGHTLQPGFLRLEMHADENAGKIQHRREDRPDDDV